MSQSFAVVIEQAGPAAMQQSPGRNHLREQLNGRTGQAEQVTAMPVRPRHHGRNTDVCGVNRFHGDFSGDFSVDWAELVW